MPFSFQPEDHPLKIEDHGPGQDLPPASGHGDGGGPEEDPTAHNYEEKLRRYRLALLAVLATVGMFFVGLTYALIMRRSVTNPDPATGNFVRDWRSVRLPAILWFNTLLLGLSSLALETARRKLFQRVKIAPALSVPGVASEPPQVGAWLGATVLFGLGFLSGQWSAWSQLRQQGIFIANNPGNSFFYILTGAHAVHLFVGVVILLSASAASLMRIRLERQVIMVDIAAWYWHFMGILWVYIFVLLAWAR
jgi:cytochrome c oxidase subunit III